MKFEKKCTYCKQKFLGAYSRITCGSEECIKKREINYSKLNSTKKRQADRKKFRYHNDDLFRASVIARVMDYQKKNFKKYNNYRKKYIKQYTRTNKFKKRHRDYMRNYMRIRNNIKKEQFIK